MTSSSPPDFSVRVGQYVRLRDHIKALKDKHADELKAPEETLEKLNGVMLAHLNNINADSVVVKGVGTVSKTTKKSASVADMAAFWNYVVAQGDFDMLDKKANKTRVEEYLLENKTLPPGVNFSSVELVGVRRANNNGK